jgi:hypothetical protein
MPGVLCTALPSDKERKAAGRALRDKIKRGDLGCWRPRKDRADPVDLIEEAHAGRLERLVPVRLGRIDGLEEYLKTLPPHWHRVLRWLSAHGIWPICGALLAKGYARSTGATMLSGYLGKGDVADRASPASHAPMPTKRKPSTRRSSGQSSPVDCPPSMELS